MSQPPTPSKLKRVFKKKNELSPKRSHSSFVFLLTGLDNSQKHLVNHICTNSSTQIVPEYTDEGTE